MQTETISEYEKQGNDFLSQTGTTLKVEFKENRKYFPEDSEARDIYNVTLIRGEREYMFTFGQSLNDSGYKTYRYNKECKTNFNQNIRNIKVFKAHCVMLFGGCGKIKEPVEPKAYDILSCLTKYNPGTFENFCDEFGYSTDSKIAERTYKGVMDEWLNLERLFNPSEMEELREIL